MKTVFEIVFIDYLLYTLYRSTFVRKIVHRVTGNTLYMQGVRVEFCHQFLDISNKICLVFDGLRTCSRIPKFQKMPFT